jgi:hypothetical protein
VNASTLCDSYELHKVNASTLCDSYPCTLRWSGYLSESVCFGSHEFVERAAETQEDASSQVRRLTWSESGLDCLSCAELARQLLLKASR